MPKEYINKIFNYFTQHVAVRFFLAGGTAGVTDLVVLYLLNSVFGLHYLISAIVAFLIAFGVSFVLHKFWTFKSHEERTHKQVVTYLLASLFGLTLNTFLMYLFVDHLHVQVILSQIIVGLMVAFVSFFVSRNIVFKYNHKDHQLNDLIK